MFQRSRYRKNPVNMNVFLFVGAIIMAASATTTGGLSGVKDATPLIQALVNDLKNEILEVAGLHGDNGDFTAVSYREQVVEGINYFIKIRIGSDDYIHAKINVLNGLESVKQVAAAQPKMTWEDPIENIDTKPVVN